MFSTSIFHAWDFFHRHWIALAAVKWSGASNMPEGFRRAAHPSHVRGKPLSTSLFAQPQIWGSASTLSSAVNTSTSEPPPSVQMSPVKENLSLSRASDLNTSQLSLKILGNFLILASVVYCSTYISTYSYIFLKYPTSLHSSTLSSLGWATQ